MQTILLENARREIPRSPASPSHHDPEKVFISYSHDSDEHRARVLALPERLRADGIETLHETSQRRLRLAAKRYTQ